MPHWPEPLGYRDISLGLHRVEALLERLGNPHLNIPPVIHIAGTNGKGSTLAFIRSLLNAAGYSTHVYTSPHLVEFNERFVVADKIISDKYLTEILEECKQAAGDDIAATFFEGTTIAAFLAFARNKADFVSLETGLGGRLDATNVIPTPALTVITSIDIDHIEFLGDDIKGIASEKAGIIKQDVPCVISIPQKAGVIDTIVLSAIEKNAHVIIPQGTILDDEKLGLKGLHQTNNANCALAAIENLVERKICTISEKDIIRGLANTKWSSRMQKLTEGKLIDRMSENIECWLDGGHNPAAAQVLVDYMSAHQDREWYVIYASLKDKDADGFLDILSQKSRSCYCVTIPNEENAYSASQLYDLALGKFPTVVNSNSVIDALDAINNKVSLQKGKLHASVIICGSLYLAGSVLNQNDRLDCIPNE